MRGRRVATGTIFYGVALLWRELILFASVGFLIGGLDELLIDILWLVRISWRQVFVYKRHARATSGSLTPPLHPGLIAVFVAAWDEAGVIGPMLRHALQTLDHQNFRIYVGCYPNDPATIAVVRAIASPKLRVVVGPSPGPTTKADCLNTLWAALLDDEVGEGVRAKAVVLHDAEDVVHAQELKVFDALIERFSMVQLPVVPLRNARSRWIAGHYCDEFAEAHGKALVVREAVGAAIPAAGVGCAFERATLTQIACLKGGKPFDAHSLTEDYELGLMIGALGGKTILARVGRGRDTVQIKAYFPETLDAAVRQKARWIAGIALAGYDRLGWSGGLAETWMRMRDRRAPMAALLLCIGYLAVVLTGILLIGEAAFGHVVPTIGPALATLLSCNALLLGWRMAMRAIFVGRVYGWGEAIRAPLRLFAANIIAMLAARRALGRYLVMRRTGLAVWEKTHHIFPVEAGG
jgi:adsorption protein B